MNYFDDAIRFVLRWEGGYVNNPADPGGETKFGISKKAYPDINIANLTEEQAKEIYKIDYWDKCGCDLLPYPENLIVFDTAVNMGVDRALNFRRWASDWTDYLFRRIEFYNQLNKPMFLKGWISRVLALYKEIQQTRRQR